MRVSEIHVKQIRVKQIRVNQGVFLTFIVLLAVADMQILHLMLAAAQCIMLKARVKRWTIESISYDLLNCQFVNQECYGVYHIALVQTKWLCGVEGSIILLNYGA